MCKLTGIGSPSRQKGGVYESNCILKCIKMNSIVCQVNRIACHVVAQRLVQCVNVRGVVSHYQSTIGQSKG